MQIKEKKLNIFRPPRLNKGKCFEYSAKNSQTLSITYNFIYEHFFNEISINDNVFIDNCLFIVPKIQVVYFRLKPWYKYFIHENFPMFA